MKTKQKTEVKFDPVFADLHEDARQQLRKDRAALSAEFWKESEPPGMKDSITWTEWKNAYEDETHILDKERAASPI